MLNEKQKQLLLKVARDSIKHGIDTGEEMHINIADYDAALRDKHATFVTLHKHEQLRGCIGILEALRPLVEDVSHNAFAAAFSDTRFSPVTADEFEELDIHISILDEPENISFSSEENLISQIRPGIDGLILQDGYNKGTFLPSVWESLPDRRDFLMHLKQKAGLPKNHWSSSVTIQRYTVEEF